MNVRKYVPELDDLLNYKNTSIIKRYEKDYPSNILKGADALSELIRYLWLNCKHNVDRRLHPKNQDLHFICAIYDDMEEIDDMWHTFLLFTEDYAAFCDKYFYKFIHHEPMPDNQEIKIEDFERSFSRMLYYVYDNLGHETLVKWFEK